MFEGLFVILGAILAFFGTFFVEVWKNKRERKEKTENFVLYSRQELISVVKGLDKLKEIQDNQKYWAFAVLDRLDRSLYNLESEKKAAIYLPNSKLQEAFIDLVSDISALASDIRGVQNLYADQSKTLNKSLFKNISELKNYYDEKKVEKLIDLVDLKRKIEDFVRQLTN
ncbi:MAG: hypothetical protein ACOZAN_03970 [Patescibacteria group bacterium]